MTDENAGPAVPDPEGGSEERGALRERLDDELSPELEIIRLLDEGTTATIFLAREPALERLVAVKVLSSELSQDPVARRRFQREARAVASVSHPNVVTVHRVGSLSDDVPYLVMEYVQGQTLAEYLAALGPIDPREGREILQSVAAALEAAHRENIVHRDVRPDNVLREDDSGRILLTDFGVAAIMASGSETVERLTATGEILSDTDYSSPEQLRGEEPSEQTDIYSFGILAYTILAGRGPYDAETPQDLVIAHLREEPRRLRDLRPDVPEALDRIAQRCLSKNPRQRPRAGQLVSLLRAEAVVPRGRAAASPGGEDGGETGTRAEDSSARPEEAGVESPGDSVPSPRSGHEGARLLSSVRRYYEELKRRKVFRVALVYAGVAWVLIQVAVATFPHLNLPSWAVTFVIVLLMLGFPVAIVLAWAFDITPEGVRRTEPSDRR